ncbi:Transmembrane protein 62 [Tritrichomonas musculus]|uniref:Transmembrane protein 62 n=1 Tax=Tritrichomonas musculus TaxID=1915356 RepID=A0ABR2HVF2_9EUKA
MENERWNRINNNEELQYENSLFYAFSNYLWLIFFCPFILYFKYSAHYQKVPIIKSFNQSEEWNSSFDPHIFGFISDMHITSKYPNTITSAELVLQVLNETGVEKILIAGDISDNFFFKKSIKHGCQIEDDFINYKSIADNYPSEFLIVASGNHDEFAVETYNSSNHFILKYCDFYSKNGKYKKYDNFLISKVKYDDIEFFVMNPYHYPTVPAGLGFSSDITKEMLDKIESFLSSPSNSKTRILMTHYPTSFTNYWTKSSSHKTLAGILASSNLSLILCGDTHHELILHTKTSLEIHARGVKPSQNSGGGYRYISIDNGGLNDQGFILNKEKPFAVLTYPVKKKYVSDRTDFSHKKFRQAEVRVVHFSENNNLNISVSCSSKNKDYKDIKTTFLKFQRIIRPNQSLYSTALSQLCHITTNKHKNIRGKEKISEKDSDSDENSLNFDDFGISDLYEFRLSFSGDWNYEAEFVSGDQVELGKEILAKNMDRRMIIISIGIFCFLIIFFVWFPLPPLKYFDRLSSWISNRRIPKLGNKINLFDKIIGILFGFIVIKSRIYNNLPKFVRLTYFAFVLSPFFLPISLMKIGENSYGFICFFGYYLNGFYVDLWGVQLTSYFALFVLLPSTFVFSSISYFKQTKVFHFVFLIDIAVAFLQLFLIKVAIGNALFQSASLEFAVTSPLFAIVPTLIIVMEIFQIWSISKSTQNSNEDQFLL